MRVSAKTDYALSALVGLTQAEGKLVSSDTVSRSQGIPQKFLESILVELRRAGFIESHRGANGGHRMRADATAVRVADVIRAINGPLTIVRGECPEDLSYPEPDTGMRVLWVALRASIRSVLEQVTIADLANGTIPESVFELTRDPESWVTHRFEPPAEGASGKGSASPLVEETQARQLLAEGALLVDVRPEHARAAQGSLPGALVVEKRRVSEVFDPRSTEAEEAGIDLARPIVVVCATEIGSAPVVKRLLELGFQQVAHVAGGAPALIGSAVAAS